jgi:exosortase K
MHYRMRSIEDDCFGKSRTFHAAFHLRVNRMLGAVLAILVMLVLKDFYSKAAAKDLIWILAPTARMVSWLTCANPVWESGVGYADFSHGIIIAPACAGINFMIMTFGLAAFCGLRRIHRLPPLLTFLALCLVGAYGAALGVNALRIVLSMALYRWDIYTLWLTPDRVHRLAGAALYLSALGLFFMGLQPIIHAFCKRFDPDDGARRTRWPFWLPFVWYLLGAVGVPMANLLFRRPLPGFIEHCATVALLVIMAFGAVWMWRKRGARANPQLRS